MHCNTQVSDDLLRQMGSVDYEAVQRDLTLLMTDSQVVITLQSGRKHQDDQNHGGGDNGQRIVITIMAYSYSICHIVTRNPGQQIMVTTGLLW